jgi:putative N6-adenine-specific DNA methylase
MTVPDKGILRRIRQHVVAKEHEFFAVVTPGFEHICERELAVMGIMGTHTIRGGISFRAKVRDVWRVHLLSRGVTRVLMRLDRFRAENFTRLHEKIASFHWELHLATDIRVICSVSCSHSRLYHTGRIDEECREGITARMRNVFGEGCSPRSDGGPVQEIFIRFEDDICTVSLDCTGEPMYRRNFRPFVERAPMRETLAACMLMEARLERYNLLLDPMCGSGVIALEGALMAGGIVPGSRRKFAFEKWPGHSEKGYAFCTREAAASVQGFPLGVSVSDIDHKSIETAAANFAHAEITDVKIVCRDFFTIDPIEFRKKKLLIAVNPPYGGRLGTHGNVAAFYKRLGDKLRKDFHSAGYAIIVPGEDAERALGIRGDRKIPFMNGGIRVALCIRDGF